MKIDLSSVDQTQFMVNQHTLNGEVVHLIQPQRINCKWTQANKIFRSSLWDSDGNLVSAALPKFPNWGENPENFPVPTLLDNCICVEKLDGSLISCTKWKGQYIIRTRGTVDASNLENGHELDIFKRDILPKLEKSKYLCGDTWEHSILFEWLSTINKIVIKFNEPQFKLIGAVYHSNYWLWNQDQLDSFANHLGLQRPETYAFNSITDLLELVKKWEGKEGIVIYSNNGQALHKIKSDWYRLRHFLKDEFSNFEKVLDYYVSLNRPNFADFQTKIAEVVDWETATEMVADISKCVDANKAVNDILNGMYWFVMKTLKPMGNHLDKKVRGLMAQKVLQAYANTNRSGMIFKLLDGKPLDNDDLKRLFYQVLKD